MAVAALTSTGCAGLYAEVVAAELMTPTVTKDDSNVDMGRLSAGPMFGINLGMDFDFDRKARFAVGYAVNTYSFGDAEGTQPSSDARVDFNLVRFSNSFKLRAGLGFGMGSGGGFDVPMKDGSIDHQTHQNGGGAYAGLGVATYLGNHFEVGALAGALGAFVGGMTTWGPTIKVTFSWFPLDDRPDSSHVVPLSSTVDIMPVIAEGARALGCDAQTEKDPQDTYDMVRIQCKEDDTTDWYYQSAHGYVMHCDQMDDYDCVPFDHKVQAAATALLHPRSKVAPATPAPSTPAPPSATQPAPGPVSAPAVPDPTTEPSAAPAPGGRRGPSLMAAADSEHRHEPPAAEVRVEARDRDW